MNDLTEFDLHVDIVFFFQGWYEKLLKKGET